MEFKKLLLTVGIYCLSGVAFSAALIKENLILTLPKGYVLGFSQNKGNILMNEWVPKNQTVNNWTEMLTIQIFYGGIKSTPEIFFNTMKKSWSRSCPGSTTVLIKKGMEQGYQFIFWLSGCPNNPITGKPEITYFKAIQGRDSFYLVQKATKSDIDKEYATKWSQYMKGVVVYDSGNILSKDPKRIPIPSKALP